MNKGFPKFSNIQYILHITLFYTCVPFYYITFYNTTTFHLLSCMKSAL